MKECHRAAYEGDFTKLENLYLENCNSICELDKDGRLPLHWSCSSGRSEMSLWLIECGPTVIDIKDDMGWTPLTVSSSAGLFEVVKLLIQKGVDVNTRNSYGCTPLHYACSKGHLQIAELLITNKANIEAAEERNNETPLHRAAAKGMFPLVKLLVESGAKVDARDMLGDTPLVRSIESEEEDIMIYLLRAGASLYNQNKEGNYAHYYLNPRLKKKLRELKLF